MSSKALGIALGHYVPTKRGYAGRQRARWVLAATEQSVLYGFGSELHRECKASTFRKWIRRVDAQRRSAADGVPELQLEAN